MKLSDIVSKISVRDTTKFVQLTKKWIGFVTSSTKCDDIADKDWDILFGRSNEAASINRGEMLDVSIEGKGKKTIVRNERKSFKSKWDPEIRPQIAEIIATNDIPSKISKVKKLNQRIHDIIRNGGGRDRSAAINRMLSIFFPDLFVTIPTLEKLNEFVDILQKEYGTEKIKIADNWIDNSFQVKKLFDEEFNDDKMNISAWRFYDYLKEDKPKETIVIKENTKATTSMDKNKYDDFQKLLLGNYNLILTGAPGTGKTYLAKKIAEAIGASEKSIKMVQFHPSYDYTDFVEGLRPIKEGDSLGFQRKDGVFKAFCKEALDSIENSSFDNLYHSIVDDISNGAITTYTTLSGIVYPLKVVDGVIKYGCKNNGTEYKSENIDNIKLIYLHYLNHPEDIDYSFEGLRGLISKLTNGQITTLDPSEYTWTIKELLSRRKAIYSNYVFIIDEINRGEISKIFGELFYSIDSGYRGDKGIVETQYQNLIPKEGDSDFDPKNPDVFRNGFYVPKNVYIIGTMNDIDRSVESMDFAMRRRFAWKEITAKSRQSMLKEADAWKPYAMPSQDIIDEIKVRMDNLNAAIIDEYGGQTLSNKDKIGLSKAYQIGAAYFLKYALYNDFEDLWTNHLEGLLYEYLRGKTNIIEKIERLHQAYNDTTRH